MTLTAGGNPTATTATLTIANRSGNWHYKHTTPAAGDCSTAQTGTTANLTGLTPNTPYTFRAYSDAGCNNRLATAGQFRTDNPSLAASGVAQTTATLTISNWDLTNDGNWYYKETSGSCSSAQSGATASLSNLTASTSYTYAAYSDSGCTSAKKVTADLAFSTLGSPTLGASNVTATTAVLTVGNHNSNWHYQADTGPHTSCSSAVSGTTANLTGLSTGTTYTYTAYSDSSCATTLATASAFTTTTPSLTASNTGTTGALTLSGWTPNRDGNWRYKAENAPYANCSSAQSGTTAGLTGLTPNTEYTFKAYSDSGCSTEIAAASAFTVPALTASSVTATTATLTLANRSGDWWLKYTTPSGGTCTAGEADFSHALTSLSTNTRYIFRAYSDSSCNNIIATASAFTTSNPGLTAGSTATATTATLTISNWAQADGAWYYKANRAPHASCSSEIAAGTTTASLSGLTMNASYTYRAYSDSSCNNLIATASAFTTDNPTLASSDVTATTATLTLSNWASADGAWHYKSTTPSGSCSSEVAAGTTTADLTSLATGTSHTFKAYSDSGCSTEIAAASVFTTSTPTLTVSNVGNTGATITLGGWDLTDDGSWYYKANASPDNTCSSTAVTTAAKSLTGLTPGDSYAYKAYSDSGCSTEIAAAGAAFVPGVTVSNLDKTLASTNYSFGGAFTKQTLRAISFTTGSNANGYTLKDITAKFADKEGNPNSISAKVYTASGSKPSTTVLATLSGSDPDTAGDYKYTCSTNCDLTASTTYFLVLSAPNSPTTGRNVYWWRSTASNSETLTPSGNGWSIGNLGLFSDSDNLPNWFEHDNPANSVVLRVVAVTK